jgi:hypothetical protein
MVISIDMGTNSFTPYKRSYGRALKHRLHVERLSDMDRLLKQTFDTDHGENRRPSIDGSQEASQAWLLLAGSLTRKREVNLAHPTTDR